MSYGRNFGMRSFENVVRDGRFRAPATEPGSGPIPLGAGVTMRGQTGADLGYLRLATAAEAPGQDCGVAVFEHIQNKSDELTLSYDSPYDRVPLGQYTQMMHGPGAKVWFANTAAKTLYDGRVRAAKSMIATDAGAAVDLTTLAPGDALVPNGLGGWRELGVEEVDGWFTVEQIVVPNGAAPTVGVVEARFTF